MLKLVPEGTVIFKIRTLKIWCEKVPPPIVLFSTGFEFSNVLFINKQIGRNRAAARATLEVSTYQFCVQHHRERNRPRSRCPRRRRQAVAWAWNRRLPWWRIDRKECEEACPSGSFRSASLEYLSHSMTVQCLYLFLACSLVHQHLSSKTPVSFIIRKVFENHTSKFIF